MPKVTKTKKKRSSPVAFHAKNKSGMDVVGLGNLRVVIVKDNDIWFAQGLDIDYAVQGSSLQNVKKNFEEGLRATIHENLKVYGNIERILKVAPQEVWKEMVFNPNRKLAKYSSVSTYKISASLKCDDDTFGLPFDSIRFVESRPAA